MQVLICWIEHYDQQGQINSDPFSMRTAFCEIISVHKQPFFSNKSRKLHKTLKLNMLLFITIQACVHLQRFF